MTTELRLRNQSQQLYVRALSSAYRNGVQLYDPSLWLLRDPDAEEKMLRDADIRHAYGYRNHLIAGRDWEVLPKRPESPRAELAVMVASEMLKEIKHFTNARLLLARAWFSGKRYGHIHSHTKRSKLGDGRERTWWVPNRIEDQDKRLYRIVPDIDGDTMTATWEKWDIVKQDFRPLTVAECVDIIEHKYQDDQASLGHGQALREALGWWWYAKEHVFQESLAAVERFAQGIITAKVDGVRDAETGLPNSQLISDWTAVLEDLRARHVLVHDISDQIEILPGNADGWQLMHTIRDELRSTIYTLIMGANLTTSANEGGSYALAEVQENSTEALIQFDRQAMEETLTDDLLGAIWWHNHPNMVELGIEDEMPRLVIRQEKRSDPKERAEVAQILNGMGVALSADDLYEQTGFRKPDPGEEMIEGAAAPAQGLLPGFGDPFGAPSPFPPQSPQAPQPGAQNPMAPAV